MIVEQFPDVAALSDELKLQLAAELWDSVVGKSTEQDEQLMTLLQERWQEYLAKPNEVVPWNEVRNRLGVRRQ